MTHYEMLTTDREELIKLIDSNDSLVAQIDMWWCRSHCPYRDYVKDRCALAEDVCLYSDDSHTQIDCWLDSEI